MSYCAKFDNFCLFSLSYYRPENTTSSPSTGLIEKMKSSVGTARQLVTNNVSALLPLKNCFNFCWFCINTVATIFALFLQWPALIPPLFCFIGSYSEAKVFLPHSGLLKPLFVLTHSLNFWNSPLHHWKNTFWKENFTAKSVFFTDCMKSRSGLGSNVWCHWTQSRAAGNMQLYKILRSPWGGGSSRKG